MTFQQPWDALFHYIAYDYSRADWDGLHDYSRDVPWEDILKLGASAAASEFCERVRVGIDVYIPDRKYQVKPHSFPWFSAACINKLLINKLYNKIWHRLISHITKSVTDIGVAICWLA